ncbi:MAG: UDP-3-O-acyl-N-acetylglucosamine deacetylase [Bdellovibrionales bacterium]|nr:UDP-3-O-acyl-N-acetylglucosamine deacetylase [Bdellovibrionales bacterium]
MNPQNVNQVTLRREIKIEGIGLHSGKRACVTLAPALPNTGILFVRKDLEQETAIPASFEFVTQTRLATTLGRKNSQSSATISTVEHLLSALKLMGVDNATVTVEGPEVPIMDGSAMAFCEAIQSAGLYEQVGTAKRVTVLKKRIEVRKGDKVASISPSSRLHIQARIEWTHAAIGTQEFQFTLGKDDFRQIADARTFGFLKDAEALQKMGLALGGSLANAIVLDETRVVNPDGLRHDDEFVRHKVLDAIGDFALSPIAILGDVNLVKAGHELHSELVAAIFASPDNYEVKLLSDVFATQKPEASVAGGLPAWVTAANLQRVY